MYCRVLWRVMVCQHGFLWRTVGMVIATWINYNCAETFWPICLLHLKMRWLALFTPHLIRKTLIRRCMWRANRNFLVISQCISCGLGLTTGSMSRSDAMLCLILVLLDGGWDHNVAFRLYNVLSGHIWLSIFALILACNGNGRLTATPNYGPLHVTNTPHLWYTRPPRIHIGNHLLWLYLAYSWARLH